MAKISRRAFEIFIGETIVTAVTILVTLAFIGSETLALIRNVLIFDSVFLIIYLVWVKLFGNYEKIYKSGLKEE